MKLFKYKYRIESTRLKEWDYSTPCWYYITVCTKDKKHWFGEVKNGKMILNKLGKIAEEMWNAITNHYNSITLDNFIIMPNHIHGIIIINFVETGHAPSLQPAKHTLGNVIGSFKSAVSKSIRKNGNIDFN